MGVPVERLPAGVQSAASALPMTYIGYGFSGSGKAVPILVRSSVLCNT